MSGKLKKVLEYANTKAQYELLVSIYTKMVLRNELTSQEQIAFQKALALFEEYLKQMEKELKV